MHIEPGIVDGAKILLSYATGAASIGVACKLAVDALRRDGGALPLMLRTAATTALVFSFFELLPHQAVGVSEVHLILGSTLFLIFGAGPAALGLALGLLLQGLFFAPFDLPQYGMNVTTLILPILGIGTMAKRLIAPGTPYIDLKYRQALALSTAYQGGIVAWVLFWAIYGRGFGAENLVGAASFGVAYMAVVLVEPLIDLAVLGMTKAISGPARALFHRRLYAAAPQV